MSPAFFHSFIPAPEQKSLLVGSKGCSYPDTQNAPAVSIYSNFPGILVASYAQFCSSNLCNRAHDTNVLLNSLSRPAAPVLGQLQCPVCVQFGGSCKHDSTEITCLNDTTHCYEGHIDTRGVAEGLQCQKSVVVTIEEDPMNSFNWTAEEVETCVKGTLCQESLVMITPAGGKTAIVATKGCISEETEVVTFIQHSAPPGLVAVSYSNYCEKSFCNGKEDIIAFWKQERYSDTEDLHTTHLHCPTCVALGTCSSAPLLPCPKGTTRCYQGKLSFFGEALNSSVEVKGCIATAGCRLMAQIIGIGAISMEEACPPQLQARKAPSGATWFPISIWWLGLLQSLVLFF